MLHALEVGNYVQTVLQIGSPIGFAIAMNSSHLYKDDAEVLLFIEALKQLILDGYVEGVFERATKTYPLSYTGLQLAQRLQSEVDASPLTSQISKSQMEADKATLVDLLKMLPSNGCIKFLREKDFGYSFQIEELEEAHVFLEMRSGPDHEFLDTELEEARVAFRTQLQKFISSLQCNTFPDGERQSIDRNMEFTNRALYISTIESLNSESAKACEAYDYLVKAARRKLGL
jgi:hypothetical protein